jgi:hypothetical protein
MVDSLSEINFKCKNTISDITVGRSKTLGIREMQTRLHHVKELMLSRECFRRVFMLL